MINLFLIAFCIIELIDSQNVERANFKYNAKHQKSYLNNHKNTQNHEQDIISLQYQIVEDKAYNKLITSISNYKNNKINNDIDNDNPFSDLLVAFYMHPIHVHNSDGKGNTEKYFVGVDAIKYIGKKYIVYTAGVNGLPQFENYMISLGASVYGFDCTDYKRKEYLFEFYPWCIGTYSSFQNNLYSKQSNNVNNYNTTNFYSIDDIKKTLNHTKIHMLKMDIEGFEWKLLYDEIINSRDIINGLPEQLLFELHTQGANPDCVPVDLVKDKKKHEVNLLVYQLWLIGYRLVNIDINFEDHYCAELSFIKTK